MSSYRLGFLGTGTITEAIVTGLYEAQSMPVEIWISPRNQKVSERLANRFPAVRVASNNQDVLDNSDVVCLAVRPQIAKNVLSDLTFDRRHHVLSFIATFSRPVIEHLVAPASAVIRVAPLPSVAQLAGTTAICPPDAMANDLFSPLGKTIAVASDADYDAMFSVTACMASFFGILQAQADWLTSKGVAYPDARDYVSSIHHGLSTAAQATSKGFAELISEFSTLGGINEQLHRDLAQAGTFDSYQVALNRVAQRLAASSDTTLQMQKAGD